MKKVIREVDSKRGLMQVTVSDERWYLKPSLDEKTGVPCYKAVPSVTFILGSFPKGIGFYRWLAEHGWDEAEAIKVAAGDKGSMVHLAIEMILNGEEFRVDTKVQDKSRSTELESYERELTIEELEAVKSFCDWKKETEKTYIVETILSEYTVFSDIHDYAGTLDWLVKLTHRETKEVRHILVDFKSSQYLWNTHTMQVSALRETIVNGENPIYLKNKNGTESKKMLDLSNLEIAILQVGYKKNKTGYKWTEVENDFKGFMLSREIWEREHGKEKPKVMDFPLVLSAGTKEEIVADPDFIELSEATVNV